MTGTPDAEPSDIVRELWEHEHDEYFGDCRYHGQVKDYHEHVAAALEPIIAARVRAAQAQAWDEGYAEGIIHMGMSIEDHAKQVNPYRSETADEFQDSED